MTTRGLAHAIDFGTSTSAILIRRPDGSTVPVSDITHGTWSVPTAISVRHDGSVLAGVAAENARNAAPAAYRREFKREFGAPTPALVGGVPLTADEMTVHLLRFLRERAQQEVPGDPERVVVTIPASWEEGKRDLMRSVVARAGYGDAEVSLVPEPVAALADAFSDPAARSEFTTLVYDLGGGTFDCAVARGSQDGFEVLGAPGGIDSIGGADFDSLLLGLLADRLGPDAAQLLRGPAVGTAGDEGADVLARRLSVRDEAEEIKCQLSEAQEYQDIVTAVRPPALIRVHRSEFETLIEHLLVETVLECERLLERHGLTWVDVDRIVPAGGSSRIPLVHTMLAKFSGRPVLRVTSPERAVVNGAAVLCGDKRYYANWERETMSEAVLEEGEASESAEGRAAVADLLDKYQDKLPKQRKPNILVCGQTGTGKTTTINTLFGEDVGKVGYFSRGTAVDELYEWESKGHNIEVVDLPGLGDTRRHDKAYHEMYRRRVAKADGFIVVVAPPRPANMATIRTVNLLLSCGVEPERIVFGYNLLENLKAPVNGRLHRVSLSGLSGPATRDDTRLIEMARTAFNEDIRREVRNGQYAHRFPLERVIAFDALTGWNLFGIFDAVLENLPGDALVKWRDAVNQAAKDIQRRTEKRIERESAEHRKKLEELRQENDRLAAELRARGGEAGKGEGKPSSDQDSSKRERERLDAERVEFERRQQAEREKLERERRRIEAEEDRLRAERDAVRNIRAQQDAHAATVGERLVNWVGSKVASAVSSIKAAWRKWR